MPTWTSKRKCKAYAVFGAMSRLLFKEAEKNLEAMELFTEIFGDIDTFDTIIRDEVLVKVNELEIELEKNVKKGKMSVLDLFPPGEEIDEDSASDVTVDDVTMTADSISEGASFTELVNMLDNLNELELSKVMGFCTWRGYSSVQLHVGRIFDMYNIDLPGIWSSANIQMPDLKSEDRKSTRSCQRVKKIPIESFQGEVLCKVLKFFIDVLKYKVPNVLMETYLELCMDFPPNSVIESEPVQIPPSQSCKQVNQNYQQVLSNQNYQIILFLVNLFHVMIKFPMNNQLNLIQVCT